MWHEALGQCQHPAGLGRVTHVPGDVSVGCAQDLLIPVASWGGTMGGKRRGMQKGDEGHNRVCFTEREVPSAALCATAQQATAAVSRALCKVCARLAALGAHELCFTRPYQSIPSMSEPFSGR